MPKAKKRPLSLKDDLDLLMTGDAPLPPSPKAKPTRATSETDPLEVGWVSVPEVRGRLGITIAPGKRGPAMTANVYHDRDLSADLMRLSAVHRADVLCDCTEAGERARLLDIPDLKSAAEDVGIRYVALPIPDVTAPRTTTEAQEAVALVTHLATYLLKGETVVVNCRGGRGRSGMIAACILAALGIYPTEALLRVRKARPGAVETREQEGFVWQAALRLLGLGWGNKGWVGE